MSRRRSLPFLALALVFAPSVLAEGTLAACGGDGNRCAPYDGGFPDVDAGEACRFPCPVSSPAQGADGDTYTSFASGFFGTYCTRCHATSRTQNCFIPGATCRFGSPPDHNWDNPASIRSYLGKIRAVVAVGDQLTMPPDLPVTPNPSMPAPTCDERFRIARWIDAGAPGLP